MNILLVDDSLLIRTVLQNTLNTHADADKFTFHCASNGKAALDIMEKSPIDLVFLDWNMPVMNGEVFVDVVRQDNEYRNTRIIMATTEGQKSSVLKMAKKGINGYIVKPFTQKSILKSFNAVYTRMH